MNTSLLPISHSLVTIGTRLPYPSSTLYSYSDVTALPESERPPIVRPAAASRSQATAQGLDLKIAKNQFAELLNRRFSKVIPAVGFAALVAQAGYWIDPTGNDLSQGHDFRAWLDKSSASTWDSVGFEDASGSGTGPSIDQGSNAQFDLVNQASDKILDPMEAQPRFDSREAIAYARRMGLPSEFPL